MGFFCSDISILCPLPCNDDYIVQRLFTVNVDKRFGCLHLFSCLLFLNSRLLFYLYLVAKTGTAAVWGCRLGQLLPKLLNNRCEITANVTRTNATAPKCLLTSSLISDLLLTLTFKKKKSMMQF